MISVHDFINKILTKVWLHILMREVIITSVFSGFYQKKQFFLRDALDSGSII